MACRGPTQPDYNCDCWTSLRDKVALRDGNRCRNCGASNRLTVHHWNPTPEYWGEVNEWGYKDAECPLVVPEAGLVTLCSQCHDALTATRKIVLGQRKLRAIHMKANKYSIFQIWKMNNKNLPFKVTKTTWNENVDHYYLVEKIRMFIWPFGVAWGSYYRNGVMKNRRKIGGAGSYQWRMKD